MTRAAPPVSSLLPAGEGPREPLVEVTVPVYNEEKVLEQSVRLLHSYLSDNLPLHFLITIADNASTDGTFAIAQRMGAELPRVRAVHLDRKGRGLALRHVWSSGDADVVAYMDADLSTGLEAFLPLIAPLTGIGAVAFYQGSRRSGWWRLVLVAAIAGTGGWAFVLLRRSPNWNPWLAWAVAGATAAAVLALASGWLRGRGPGVSGVTGGRRGLGWVFAAAGVAGLIAVLAGPAAYALTPLSQTISGGNPLAGPTAGGGGFAGGFPGPVASFAGLAGGTGPGGGTGRAGVAGGTAGAGLARGGFGGSASRLEIAYLEAHRDGATWLVAVQGSSAAASIILATGGVPVMAMGGFRGTDPAPTLAQFEQDVKQGKLHYVLTGGRGGLGGGGFGGGGSAAVTSWVEQNCTVVPASAYGGSATASAAGGLYHCG
jgi:Glycosyl transferase family 2